MNVTKRIKHVFLALSLNNRGATSATDTSVYVLTAAALVTGAVIAGKNINDGVNTSNASSNGVTAVGTKLNTAVGAAAPVNDQATSPVGASH
jgi:hypothetical protein